MFPIKYIENNLLSAEIFTAGLLGITGANIPLCGVAVPGWNTVPEPAMPTPSKSPHFNTLR